MTALSFTVPGDIVPWSVQTAGKGGHIIASPQCRAWKRGASLLALKARQDVKRAGIDWPLDGIYAVDVHVVREDWQRFDPDRALNSVLDAMTGVLYEDDRARFVRRVSLSVGEPVKGAAYTRVMVTVAPPKPLAASRVAAKRRRT